MVILAFTMRISVKQVIFTELLEKLIQVVLHLKIKRSEYVTEIFSNVFWTIYSKESDFVINVVFVFIYLQHLLKFCLKLEKT